MSALGGWLKQIVLVVMLAILADMLLPTRTMQKYVRMVMGLAIIAVMLGPVTPLTQRDWAAHLADWALRQIDTVGAPPSSHSDAVAGWGADQLEKTLAEQQNRVANHNLAQALEQGLNQQFGIHSDGITVSGAAATHSPSVVIRLPATEADRADTVRDWVARTLEILPTQVQVVIQGGEGDGMETAFGK
ncbi:MAG: stage III sporulation protein AF [Alicyclobacillus herbarius]|uniref:stage III sporulation protein AF n=1 Tax=Alicyclobacillus herbarius TaxID=122960 RepID=UPI0023575325|nr:stage III sporulation protein AF [Alicyclobacillus herbarius]MCL6631649.1 stage III sporulation protein AF [Alicyclobacillus herbarius]